MFNVEDIKDPSFLKQLNKKELKALAEDIRSYLIQNVAKTGGHLGSNLGVVEITMAMHYVFNSPEDKLLFDVGHQAYVHKILTGRAKEFDTLRQTGGLSGYISRSESEHDIWESGHSSTSISAQAGMIAAQKYTKEKGRVIALIGDSSIANGVAFEGINFQGQYKDRAPIIILNDNKMGINRSVGALTKFLNKMRGTKPMRGIHIALIKIFPSWLTNFCHKIKRGIKGFVQKDNVFEDLGFDYYGPYEGNEIMGLIRILKKAQHLKQPCIIHIITRKGQGYKPAEDHMTKYHGLEGFDPETGEIIKKSNEISFSQVVSNALVEERKKYPFTVICPAMVSASQLIDFKALYPEDCYDVGIAEEHAAVMAAGMALAGAKVVVAMYSTFSQRAFDQILNDICRQNLNVVFTLDRAGVVGADGPTHQGIYDVAMLSLMPNIKIAMGRNAEETKGLIAYGLSMNGPIAIRYPRLSTIDKPMEKILDEAWVRVREGKEITILSYGPDIDRILEIVETNGIDAEVINARFIRPLDTNMLDEIALKKKPFLIYEEVVRASSLGMMIGDYYILKHYDTKQISTMSFDTNTIVQHGNIMEVLEIYHLGDKDILERIKELIVCD